MNLERATEGFELFLKSEGYSNSTIELYRSILSNLCKFLQNLEVSKIKSQDLQRYMVFLQEEYTPK